MQACLIAMLTCVLLLVSAVALLFQACWIRNEEPTPYSNVRAEALSNHTTIIEAYEVPKGIFANIVWPSPMCGFKLVVLDVSLCRFLKDYKEQFYEVPAPSEFRRWKKDVTRDWKVAMTTRNVPDKKITFLARRADGSKAIQLELPIKKRQYDFAALNNAAGDEILIFGDATDEVADKGLFGYVMIMSKPRKSSK